MRVVEYWPNFVERGDEAPLIVSFETLDELLAVPFVAQWKDSPNFYRFSVSDEWLMAELRGGREWWVVAKLPDGFPEGLPKWDRGIYVLKDADGYLHEISGANVQMSCVDEVTLEDGRVMQWKRK